MLILTLRIEYYYLSSMQMTAGQLAHTLGGTLIGNPDISASRISGIEKAIPDSISFLGNLKYRKYLAACKASIILIPEGIADVPKAEQAYISLQNVMAGLQQLSDLFHQADDMTLGISDRCSIDENTVIADGVGIGDFTIISNGVEIGQDTQVHGQVYLGKNVRIGKHCIIYPGVKIYHGSIIGDRVVIHSNAVIGSDGFGYSFAEGSYQKIHQLGNVIIEDDVEIGSNTVIDRAAFDSTIIKKGVKLDNLIQIAHNVEVGSHTAIAAQSGVAGSAKIGEYCRVGGQVAIVGHIEVADGSQIQGKSGVASSIKEKNKKWYGYPAISFYQYLKSYALFKQLPEMMKELIELRRLMNR